MFSKAAWLDASIKYFFRLPAKPATALPCKRIAQYGVLKKLIKNGLLQRKHVCACLVKKNSGWCGLLDQRFPPI